MGTECVGCRGQANVLVEGWTPDGPMQEHPWTCPRCGAANTILVSGKPIGLAIHTVRIQPGPRH